MGPAILVSGLAPGGAAEQCGAIKVGDELMSVDSVGVGDRDIPAQFRKRSRCCAVGYCRD